MSGVDWDTVAARSRGVKPGSVDWGSQGGGWNLPTSIPTDSSSSQEHHSGGIGGFLGNLGDEVESGITDAANAGVGLAQMTAHTFSPHGLTENVFAKNPTGIHWLDSILNAGRDPSKPNASQDPMSLEGGAVVPFVKQERYLYGSALHGNFRPIEHHPLQPILDLATVLSGGGALAAKAAEAGRLGETAAELANSDRVLQSGELSEPLNKARTLQGRYLQRKFDEFSMADPDRRIVGANPRLARISDVRGYRRMIRAQIPMRAFQQITAKLSKDQRFAFHIGVEGVPLDPYMVDGVERDGRIAMYEKQLAEHPTRALRDYVKVLKRPGVRDALENPTDAFTQALHEGKALEQRSGQTLIDAGKLTEEGRAERAVLPQRFAAGAEHVPAQTIRSVPVDENLAARHEAFRAAADAKGRLNRANAAFRRLAKPEQSRIEQRIAELEPDVAQLKSQIAEARQPIDEHQLPKGVESTTGRAGAVQSLEHELAQKEQALGRLYRRRQAKLTPAYESAMQELGDARDAHRAAQEQVRAMPPPPKPESVRLEGGIQGPDASRFIGQPNLIHPDFPEPFRFPHIGGETPHESPGLFTQPNRGGALSEPKTPGFLKRNTGLRLRTARMMTSPWVLSQDYLSTMRLEHLLDMRDNVLRPVSKELSADLHGTGYKKPDEFYFYDKPTSKTVPREVRERDAIAQDQGITDIGGADDSGHNAAVGADTKETVFRSLSEAPAELRDKTLEELKEMGVRRVPAAFAKRYQANFAATGRWMRLFWDRPTDVWRALTLNLRPAWMVNNLVGNAVQYALRYAGPNGAAAYLQALLHVERGEDKVLEIGRLSMRVPTLRRAWGEAVQEIAPELHGSGAYGANVRLTKEGAYEKLPSQVRGPIDAVAATRIGHAAGVGAHVAGVILKAMPRAITSFERHIAESAPRDAALMMELRPVFEKLGLANQSMGDALRALATSEGGQREIELAIDRVNDYLGDFNAMNPTERRVIKRLIPFESWYRVIAQVSTKYAIHYPGRVNLLFNLGRAYQADDKSLPSWLRGAIKIGGDHGGVQAMLSTEGLNPYETLPQVATQNPAGVFNPLIQAGFAGGVNVDPFTMGTYRGPGAQTGSSPAAFAERYLGALYSGLVPTRLVEQTTGPSNSTLYSPKTYGHVGPVALNDYLLQYLGLPIRHVNKARAAEYAQEGR